MPNLDVGLELYYDGSWHDLVDSDDVLAAEPITVQRGDGAESNAPRPASLSARLENRDDRYRAANPESPLYGKVGRNTPFRVKVAGVVRGATEATSWRAGQSRAFTPTNGKGNAWVDVESGGLLQRVNNWTEPLRSTLFEANNALTTTVGYWPAEEKRGAQQLTAITPGSISRSLRGFSFDGQSYPAGSGPVLDLSTSAQALVSGTFAPHTSGGNAGWQVSWVMLHNRIEGAGSWSTIMQIRPADAGYVIVDRGDSNKVRIQVYTSTLFADPALLNVSAALPSVSSDIWAMYVLRATRSGSTVTMRLFRALAGESSFTEVLSGTYSGTLDRLDRWQTGTGLDNSEVSVGHVIGVVGQTNDLTDGNRVTAFNGHNQERTAYRFARLCGLKGLPYFIRGDPDRSAQMGPQLFGRTLAEEFRLIRDTEDGIIFDELGGLYLIFTVRNARYNVTPVTLDVTELPFVPEEVSDDLGVHNLITVTNTAGGQAVAVDATGSLGTAPPPDGVGEYRQDIDVSVYDVDLLPQHANWWLRRGTVDMPRYPRVTVDLAAVPGRTADVESIDIGDTILITGYRENPIRLFVIGYTEVIGWPISRKITFTCFPDQQFDVGTYGTSSTQKRYDMKTATIKVAATSTATQLILKATDDETWSNTSTYDVMIAGERITFQAGQMGARTGTAGNYQQIVQNVLRSRNGIVKALPVGAEIHVYEQGRWAL